MLFTNTIEMEYISAMKKRVHKIIAWFVAKLRKVRLLWFFVDTQTCVITVDNIFSKKKNLDQSVKGPVFSFEITEFCYKGSNICVTQALGVKTHFDISGHFVITEFD